MPLENIFKVAIFDEFLDAFSRIPRAKQKKVSKFLRKFRQDPTQASINYEPISSFADPRLRTVRIDLEYRAIVQKPEKGNTYLLLWVDHHDKAMRWAENKTVSIHPETGAIQVFSRAAETSSRPTPIQAEEAGLFTAIRDRELLRLGVPEALLPEVRSAVEPEDLEALGDRLPPDAFEALYWLSEGETLDEVERAMAVSAEPSVDTSDFEKALERDATKRRFVVVEDDARLEAMLDAPLEKWRIFLHPSQRQLVERRWNGPVRVLGGAGTGKTVVAMHRAAHLAEKIFTGENDRILFTTFTKNLASDTRANLERLASPEAMSRIEVVNIDKWVRDLLLRAGYSYEIKYWRFGSELANLWEEALGLAPDLGFPPSFYRDEWELVVQAQGCESFEDYKRANRSGRGVRMSRGQRKAVWPVFEEYRHRLERRSYREPEDAMRDAATLLEEGRFHPSIRSIVVDEAQDMSTNAFRLLRAVIPEQQKDDLFIVGDGHQRIYRKRVVLSRAGVDIRGRGRRLRINYRTTDEIRRYAVALLEGHDFDDLDGSIDSRKGYRSLTHGELPATLELPSFDAEADAIARWLEGVEPSHACLVARTNDLADRYANEIENRGIPTLRLRAGTTDDSSKAGLRVATMHRVKGLEYNHMIVAGLSDENMPWRVHTRSSEDSSVQREAELMERALLYVALTRARKRALVTAHGKISEWVAGQLGAAG